MNPHKHTPRIKKDLKSRLKRKDLTIGSWITIGHPSIAEIMSMNDFDWLTIDLEHSPISLNQAQQLIQVIELSGITPLVRVGENNPNIIKRVMDAGAHGVIVPMVNSKEDALKALEAVKYPPIGTRGVGLARAQGYGLDFSGYLKWVNEKSILIVQIEHYEAVNNLEQILEINEIDGFMVGPYDLSASLGKPGNFDHPEVKDAINKVMNIASKFDNAVPGFHVIQPAAEEVINKIKEGYKFIAFSLDTLFLSMNCKNELAKLKDKK